MTGAVIVNNYLRYGYFGWRSRLEGSMVALLLRYSLELMTTNRRLKGEIAVRFSPLYYYLGRYHRWDGGNASVRMGALLVYMFMCGPSNNKF